MPKIIFDIWVGKHEIEAQFSRNARFRVRDGVIRLFPDSPHAANLLGPMGCYEVREICSDNGGQLFEVLFGESAAEIPVRTRKFNRDHLPVLEVVNPWEKGTSKYFRGEDEAQPGRSPSRNKWRSGHRTRLWYPEY